MINISIVDDRKCRIRERQTDAEVMSLIDYPESGFSYVYTGFGRKCAPDAKLKKHLRKLIFGIPAAWDPTMMKIIGALAAVNQVNFPETPGDGAGQTPALDFRFASRHAGSGGALVALIFMEMNRNPRIIYRGFSMVWEVGCSTNG